ncbi:MAG: hypothetical protein GF320_18085 [Armatimonadia bacterium]|nr:hypothetical protein [Armatimonadia bacterium]
MANIPSTLIGTSDPPNLAEGIALFPGHSVNLASATPSATLWNVNPQILAWRIHSLARVYLTAGIGGPAYAWRLRAEGSTSGNQMALNISEDEYQAGILMGMQLNFNFVTSIEQWCIHWVWDGWHSHFEGQWRNIFSSSATLSLDLITLLITVVVKLIEGSEMDDPETTRLFKDMSKYFPSTTRKTYGLMDDTSGLVRKGGSLTLHPTLHLDINLLGLFTGEEEMEELEGMASAFAKACGHIQAGPSIGLSLPTTIGMTKLKADNDEYTNLSFSGSTVTGTGPDADSTVNEVGIELSHEPGFDITAGFFAGFSILKIFAYTYHWQIGLLGLLGIAPTAGPYYNTRESSVGATSISSTGASPIEVVLEEPEAVS